MPESGCRRDVIFEVLIPACRISFSASALGSGLALEKVSPNRHPASSTLCSTGRCGKVSRDMDTARGVSENPLRAVASALTTYSLEERLVSVALYVPSLWDPSTGRRVENGDGLLLGLLRVFGSGELRLLSSGGEKTNVGGLISVGSIMTEGLGLSGRSTCSSP